MDSPSPPKKDVFVSYSAIDKQWAEDACAAIEARQLSCWIAPRDILPGSEWGAAIISGIDACRVMVLIFSKEADSSPQVRREIERGIGKGLVILPFRVEDVKPSGALEYALSNTHWLDGFKTPRQRQLDLLADAVSQLLTGHGSAAFPVVRQPAKSRSRWTAIWIAAAMAAAILAATVVVLLVANNSSTDQVQPKEAAVGPDKSPEIPETTIRVLPRGGLWKFEMRSESDGQTQVLIGHFRILDRRADRRVFLQKEKPSSPKFEKPVGSAAREGAEVQANFEGLRGADLKKNFQRITGKGPLTMLRTGEWSGNLVDKDQRKWDFRCGRISD